MSVRGLGMAKLENLRVRPVPPEWTESLKEEVVYSCWVRKQSRYRAWQLRWLALTKTTLVYFHDDNKREIRLEDVRLFMDNGEKFHTVMQSASSPNFMLEVDGRKINLQCDTAQTATHLMRCTVKARQDHVTRSIRGHVVPDMGRDQSNSNSAQHASTPSGARLSGGGSSRLSSTVPPNDNEGEGLMLPPSIPEQNKDNAASPDEGDSDDSESEEEHGASLTNIAAFKALCEATNNALDIVIKPASDRSHQEELYVGQLGRVATQFEQQVQQRGGSVCPVVSIESIPLLALISQRANPSPPPPSDAFVKPELLDKRLEEMCNLLGVDKDQLFGGAPEYVDMLRSLLVLVTKAERVCAQPALGSSLLQVVANHAKARERLDDERERGESKSEAV